jgi:hypothetical protein
MYQMTASKAGAAKLSGGSALFAVPMRERRGVKPTAKRSEALSECSAYASEARRKLALPPAQFHECVQGGASVLPDVIKAKESQWTTTNK